MLQKQIKEYINYIQSHILHTCPIYGQELLGSIIPVNAVKQNAFSHEVFDTQFLVSQGSAMTRFYPDSVHNEFANAKQTQSLHLSAGPANTKQVKLQTAAYSCQNTWHVLASSYLK